jgi:kumamolisin
MTFRLPVKRLENFVDRALTLSSDLTRPSQGFPSGLLGYLTPRLPEVGRTAKVVAQYYNFPEAPTSAPTIAIISLGGSYRMADLTAYWQAQGIPGSPQVNHVSVGGATNSPEQPFVTGDGSEENTLDIEIASSICPSAPIVVYFGENSYAGFLQAVTAAVQGPARIISISWGGPESSFHGRSGIQAFELLFQQAQAAGKVVIGASGDNGSSDNTQQHITDYPACSPSVLCCGGTSWLADGREVGWSWNASRQWGGGGGVSGYFEAPSYQRGVVGPYSGRACPDLAMLADVETGWSIYFKGKLEVNSWGGTSCVAPAVAGLLACYNLASYANIHQQLYSVGLSVAFRDILVGNNDSLTGGRDQRYSAKKGYDLVTGWGSPHGIVLRSALLVQPVGLKQ